MKKNLVVILIGISVLACNVFSPAVSPTQSVDVVFRSPRDMNLQPRDVPDLEEVPVEEPSDVALLPEAIDQDQRAYVSVEQNIYVESSVIMVPERTTRQPREVADEIVKYRNSRMRIAGSERNVSVGEKAIIIGITGYCSSIYSDGFILVFYRNNIIVVIIACGNVNEEYVRFIAAKVENNVKAPPAPEEIAGEETRQAVLTPIVSATDISSLEPTLLPTVDICDSLTPEECANAGYHKYSWILTDYPGCIYGPPYSGDKSFSVKFQKDSVDFGADVWGRVFSWVKINLNEYQYTSSQGHYNLTFTQSGALLSGNFITDKPCYLITYTLIE